MKNVKINKKLAITNAISMGAHARRVNVILLSINWVNTIATFANSIATGKPAVSVVSMNILFWNTLICTILVLKKKNEMIVANLLCYTILLTNFINNYDIKNLNEVAQVTAIVYFIQGIAYMTIYLNKKSFTVYALILSFLAGVLTFKSNNLTILSPILFLVILIIAALFFVTKWGGELIAAADTKGKEAMRLLENQQKIADNIEQNTTLLNTDIVGCNTYLESITETSGEFVRTVQEVAKGVTEQAGSLTDVNNMINNADTVITETAEISSHMSKVTDKARSVVNEGAKNITEMSNQMVIINNAVSKSFTTVSELQKSMDEINTFLEVIAGIAEQTNLLSLNAAIEAARAGEYGKGFAIVASEIRKLADQSVNSTGMINKIVSDIKNKSAIALKEVEAGNIASKSGENIVKVVNTSFENIQISFNEIDFFVEKELKAIEKTSEIFKKVRMEVMSVANISEEHSASSEEMFASIEELSSNIENIFNLMKQIQGSCENLEQMTKQTNEKL